MIARKLIGLFLFATSMIGYAAELRVAQVSPESGPLGPNGVANYVGAKAYFDQVNASGGIHGQRIKFLHEDDQYKPDETLRLLELVAQRDKPLVFINALGSANVGAVLKAKTAEKLAIPIVGVTPGSEALRNPGSNWIFHIHAGDHAQLRRIVTHLATLGINRIAVVYQDLPFGVSGLAYTEELAAKHRVTLVGRISVKPGADDLQAVARSARDTDAQAYVMILAPNSGIAFVRDARVAGDMTPMYSLSYVPVNGLLDKVPAKSAAGIGIAQVTPNVYSNNTGLVRDFHATMDNFAPQGSNHSQLHLVGYMSARVTVEALRRAGPNATPERVADALRQMRTDMGGYLVDFTGNSNNVASSFVDIGVVTRTGRLMY